VTRRARALAVAFALALPACGARSTLDAAGGTSSPTTGSTTSSEAGGGTTVVLATSPPGNYGIAVNTTTVFWTSEDGNVRSVPIAGGPVTTLASGQTSPEGIAADEVNVYWVNAASFAGEVLSLSAHDPGGSPLLIANGQPRPEYIAIDHENIYWTETDGEAVIASAIGPVPAQGVYLATVQARAAGIAVRGGTVFWADRGSGPGQGSIMAGNAFGPAAPTTLVSGRSYPSAVAVDATSIYWLDTDGNQPTSKPLVMKMPQAGGAAVTLATPSSSFVSSIAVDGTRVYWTQGGPAEGAVMAVSIEGGAPVTLASGQADPLGLAVDAKNVYWVNNGASGGMSTVMRLAK
jgi:hypothetical protein